MNEKKRTNPLLFLILCFGILISGVFFKARSLLTPYNELNFNSNTWRSARTAEQREQRAKMVGDLVHNNLKIGMAKKQIVLLLGPPDKMLEVEGVAPHSNSKIKKFYEYDMGHVWMDLAGQHHILLLYFDSSQHYISSEVTKD